jgi:hypothetical protein
MHSLRPYAVVRPDRPSCGSFSRPVEQRPLRIVRAAPGRLVISGRMVDVCAELDRLAALEGALKPAQTLPAFGPAR